MQTERLLNTLCHTIRFVCDNCIREEAGFTAFLSHLRHMQLSVQQTDQIVATGCLSS